MTALASAFAFLAGRYATTSPAAELFERRPDPMEPRDPSYQTQKMESLGRLTGGIAHDFNNLLTVVLGNATALRVDAEARGDLQSIRRAEMIERAAERGGRLASQLLAYSRKQMLRPQTVSVYRIIEATSELLAQAAGETARIRLHSEPDLWNCHVDPGQLESAILNLVLNARDAMPVGGAITIRCRNHRARRVQPAAPARVPGDYVCIELTDTGCGIEPELIGKVFEPFFTTKPVGQGSGLGLSQVYGFAGQSGGWVELESEHGSGTTVFLYLPRERRQAAASGAGVDAGTPIGQNQTVLVVEPDTDLLGTACETLLRAGYNVLTAANGSAALAHLVSDAQIHLMLTEAALPAGVSGIELARSASHLRIDLRVLLTSGLPKVAAGDRRFDFLAKPYRPADLVRVVGAVQKRDTFSTETEELLADARAHAPLSRLPKVSVAEPAETRASSAPVRRNAIRLAVMPFRIIGSETDASFPVGLAEEISTAFSRFRPILCVAPASVAALVDEPSRQSERWQQLNLDFLVDGSLRRKGNEIRVLLRLVNMRGAGQMSWGRRFDSLMPEVLKLQDQIASEIAAQIAPELVVWEGQEAASRPKVDPTAYDLMLRAIPATYRLDEAGFREAGDLLERSVALDPTCASCHSWLAFWYLFLLGQGWASNYALAVERADYLSQQAVILDPDDARGFTVAGHVRAFLQKDAEAALWLHERAIALNPNLALAWCYSGLAHSYLGDHAEAIRRIRNAQQLSPYDPQAFFFHMALGMPLLLGGQYEAAAQEGRRARDLHPGLSSTSKGLIAALGHLGARREAAFVRKALLAQEPGFSVTTALDRSPLRRREDRERYAAGLRLAGIPD